jgi:flagellar biosynthesis/type III secretory pathway M-ring protein FliF/YscJ
MRWVLIVLIVFICAFLLIKPMYTKKDKKAKGPLHESEQDNGGGSEATPNQ